MARRTVHLIDKTGHNFEIEVDAYPQECPICHTSIHPCFVSGICHENPKHNPQTAFRCTAPSCGRLFLAEYQNIGSNTLRLGKTEPVYPRPVTFPEQIGKVSPPFIAIYNQAVAAEAANLDQITGIGLRKALEFLVKDFACLLQPNETETIKAIPLARCIEEHITDERIRTCAKLAVWLGNDEAHYVRKWQDKDISDLKLLIRLTVNWIENHLLTEEYKKEMTPDGHKKTGQP